MTSSLFQDRTDVYEALVDWPKRLAHEEPFYRRWFTEAGVKSLLDAACGTGHHAAMFHDWGLTVEGADISSAMIERARRIFGELDGLRWVIRGFQEPVLRENPFDTVLCVGNSLALAPDEATAQTALRQMLSAIRPGGLLIVHVLNLWRLPDGPCVWQKCKTATLSTGDVLLLKGVHRAGDRGFVELVAINPQDGKLLCEESVPFLGFEAEALAADAQRAGAGNILFFGGYEGQSYNRQKSADLISVIFKR
jgi:SAM-dependent methyltransferase